MVITSQDMNLMQTVKSQTVQSDVTGELMYVNFEDRDDLMNCSYEMADSIGKTEEYYQSLKLDRECKKTIDEAINDYFDDNRLDEHVLEPVFQKFCPERIKNVLANSIIDAVTPPEWDDSKDLWDKRYRDNREWAIENASPDENRRFYFDSHPGKVNLFINMFRKETANLDQLQQEMSNAEPQYINFNDKQDFYPGSFEQAKENGETDLFRKSDRLNKRCVEEMNSAIEGSWDGMRVDINAIYPVLENYCPERISRVLAETILYQGDNGRFSSENREWAKSIRPDWDESHPDDHIRVLPNHPDKVNQFAGIYRQALPKFNEMEEKQPVESESERASPPGR